MIWDIEVTDEFRDWYEDLDQDDQEKIRAAVARLEQRGPALGRPLVGEVIGSRHGNNMKELIPPAGGGVRVLFMFDPRRSAVLLVGGDKTGDWHGWHGWYDRMIPVADDLYEKYLNDLRKEGLIK